jgi:glycosyltransferase involved in cell wall biosynthesis
MSAKKKAVLITNIPTPYRIPLFNEMNELLQKEGWEFKVVFGASGYRRRKWIVDMEECRFAYRILDSRSFNWGDIEKVTFTYLGLCRLLRQEKPDVVVTNAFSPATAMLYLRSFFTPTRYIIWSGAIVNEKRPEARNRIWFRRRLTERASAFVAYGTKASEYLLMLGAYADKIFICMNTVDICFFSDEVEKIRSKMPKKDKKKILYMGQMTRGKRLDLLLQATALMAKDRNDFQLELLGEGSEEANLRRLAAELNIGDVVKFEGFKQKSDIPFYLAQADCFAFPSSYDIWGLVLVEAMAAGLPCVASAQAGAVADLIPNETVGFAINFEDITHVAEKLAWILSHEAEASLMGARAKQFIYDKFSLRKSALDFVAAITCFSELNR